MRHDQTYVTFALVVTSPLHKSHNQEMVEVVVSRKSQRSLLRGKRSRMTILRSSLKHSKYSNPAQLWLLLSCHFILKEGCCLDNMGTRGLQAYEETLVWHYILTYFEKPESIQYKHFTIGTFWARQQSLLYNCL